MPTCAPKGVHVSLTDRQRELLALLAAGHTIQSAADTLSISRHTAKTHLRAAFLILRVHTQASAVARAISEGAITL